MNKKVFELGASFSIPKGVFNLHSISENGEVFLRENELINWTVTSFTEDKKLVHITSSTGHSIYVEYEDCGSNYWQIKNNDLAILVLENYSLKVRVRHLNKAHAIFEDVYSNYIACSFNIGQMNENLKNAAIAVFYKIAERNDLSLGLGLINGDEIVVVENNLRGNLASKRRLITGEMFSEIERAFLY